MDRPSPYPPAERSPGDDRRARIGRPVKASPEVLREVRGAGVPAIGALLQALQADRLEVTRQAGPQGPQRGGILVRHQPERLQVGLAPQRRPARQELVEEDRAEAA